MMGLGVPEMIFIFGAALLLFGPRKLPEIGRTLGKGMAEFRKASAELRRTLDTESIEQEVRETQKMVRDNDPRRYLREAAELDKRRVARGSSAQPAVTEEPVAEAETESAPATGIEAAADDGAPSRVVAPPRDEASEAATPSDVPESSDAAESAKADPVLG